MPEMRSDHFLPLVPVQPSPPPTEGTVGDDIVLALRHQPHVKRAVFARIPVYESCIIRRQMFTTPGNVIGEHVEMDVIIFLQEIRLGGHIVFFRQQRIITDIVSTANVDAYGRDGSHLFGQFRVPVRREPESEVLAYCIGHLGEILDRLPVPVQQYMVEAENRAFEPHESGLDLRANPRMPAKDLPPDTSHLPAARVTEAADFFFRGFRQIQAKYPRQLIRVIEVFLIVFQRVLHLLAQMFQLPSQGVLEHLVAKLLTEFDDDHIIPNPSRAPDAG